MRRLLPRSLLGQMVLLMGTALLIAQLVNLSLLLNREQRLALAQSEGPAVARFVQTASLVTALGGDALPDPPRRRGWRPRAFTLARTSIVGPTSDRDARLERKLASALRDANVPALDVRAGRNNAAASSGLAQRRFDRGPPRQLILLSAQLTDGQWLNARLFAPRQDPWLIYRLIGATLLLYLLVLGAIFWIARRIARPLHDLTRAAEGFAGRGEAPSVDPSGPADLRQAIEAFNAMNRRVVALLDEKDRMLGAIGHDLRTPLASMRIRAEGLEPEAEREALVRTIEEMTETLEDILVLARTGRSREKARLMDVAALVDSTIEDFRALDRPVTFEESRRVPLEVHPNLLRRAIRNLVDNAVKYGGVARVRVVAEGQGAAIEVDDDGPGISDDRLEQVMQPFERLEASRSRDTGGVGLGLAIASAVAQAHGGSLTLINRPEGGLRARLVI